MISADTFFGKGYEASISADFTLSHLLARAYTFVTTSGLNIVLPSGTALGLRTGMPIFYLWNNGSNTFTLKSATGATITTVAAGSVALVGLSRQSNSGWIVSVRAKLT